MIDAKDFEAMEALFHEVRELPPEEASEVIAASDLPEACRAMLDDMLASDRREREAERQDDPSRGGTVSEAHRLLGGAFGGADGIDWQAAVDAAVAMGEAATGADDDLPQLVGDRYLLTEILSRNLVGVAYRAVDQRTRQKVCVRRIRLLRDDGLAPRLRRSELKRLGTLEHPGLERVLDTTGLTGPAPFVVTELTPGRTLDAWMDVASPPRAESLGVFVRACRALAEAHRARVLHRRIRPASILVGEGDADERIVRLVDFGVELGRAGRATDAEAVACAAPELASIGVRPSVQSDLYAMGAILRWLATGDAASISGARKRWSRSASAVGQVEPALAAIIDRAVATDPVDRHASADALADDVEAFLAHRPVPTFVRGPLRRRALARAVYRARCHARRRPEAWLGMGALAAALLLLASVLALRAGSDAADALRGRVDAAIAAGDWNEARDEIRRGRERGGWSAADRRWLDAARQDVVLLSAGLLEIVPGPRAQILSPPAHAGVARVDPERMRDLRNDHEQVVLRFERDGSLDLDADLPGEILVSIAASLTDLDLHRRAAALLERLPADSPSAPAAARVRAVLDARRALFEGDNQALARARAALEAVPPGERGAAALALIALDRASADADAENRLSAILERQDTSPAVRRFAERLVDG